MSEDLSDAIAQMTNPDMPHRVVSTRVFTGIQRELAGLLAAMSTEERTLAEQGIIEFAEWLKYGRSPYW